MFSAVNVASASIAAEVTIDSGQSRSTLSAAPISHDSSDEEVGGDSKIGSSAKSCMYNESCMSNACSSGRWLEDNGPSLETP